MVPILMLCKKKYRFPRRPGVYFFQNKRGRIIYLGKAANLKSRLSSYFSPRLQDIKTTAMLREATTVGWRTTDSEIEALILESRLIKKHRPRFNILMRDDKQYFYATVTKEMFPRIFISHRRQAGSQGPTATITGPFTDGQALKTALKYLRRAFPYCTCRQKHYTFCLNYHLGNCLGYCCLKNYESQITEYKLREYRKNIKAVQIILNGRQTSLVKKLEKEMTETAKKGNFEKAVELRDKITKIKKTLVNARLVHHDDVSSCRHISTEWQRFFRLPAAPHRIESYDIANIQGKFAVGAMAVFTDGQPDKKECRLFKIKSVKRADDLKMLQEILCRRGRHSEWPRPDLILIDGGLAHLRAARQALPTTFTSALLIALAKGKDRRGSTIWTDRPEQSLPIALLGKNIENLILAINQETHRLAIRYYRRRHRHSLVETGSKNKKRN